jgi:acetate kinase
VRILTVNAGSTSIKVSLVGADGAAVGFESLEDAALRLEAAPEGVAHRLVHGGMRTDPAIVDDAVRHELEALVELDPLHERPELEAVDHARKVWPATRHVAVFDTAFHATISPAARHYALPEPWRGRLPAFGFHGLSHSWSTQRLQVLVPQARRVVVAHLGGGSSLCGAVDGASRITTMGFTPLDGLVMASRVGRIDPGAVRWLSRHAGVDVDELLTRRSGLVGLTGTSDFREVISRAAAGDGDAQLGLDMWEHRFMAELGGCIAALGGLDALVFTGGIGEHADGLRSRLCDRLGWLGVQAGAPVNIDGSPYREQELSTADSAIRVFVIPAREDLVLAREAAPLLAPDRKP